MRRALFLAETQGKYALPNPKVGAVLVKAGRIVGEGATGPYGGPHAEVVALRKAGARAKGATLYVTLEPCNHYGKTPPCVDAILKAGVRKVVAATEDPFPLVRGMGFKRLRKSGIEVKTGLLEREARLVNESFLLSVRRGRPEVILKAAVSLDGKIATAGGRSKWITGEKARKKTHELRSQADALLVGTRTVLKDNPSLTVRLPGYNRKDGWPLRIVLDSRLQLSLRARVFQGIPQTIVFSGPKASSAKARALEKKGIRVFRVPMHQKVLSLRAILKILHELNVRTLLVEGGGQVHASFLREKLADKVALFLSPKIFGGNAPAWVGGKGIKNPNRAPSLEGIQWEKVGNDYLLTGKVRA